MPHRHFTVALATLLPLMLMGACNDSTTRTGPPTDTPQVPAPTPAPGPLAMLEGEWQLDSIRGTPVAELLADTEVRQWPDIHFQGDGTIGGSSGVNQWGSQVDLLAFSEGRFEIESIHSTLIAGPDDAMRVEADYLTALQRSTRLNTSDIERGRLALESETGETLLTFTRSDR
ncbi:MAG: META domain-containing protein [Phycisphaerales bacterium]